MIKKILLIPLIVFCIDVHSQVESQKEIAFTLDDLPTLSHGLLSEDLQNQYFLKVLATLDKYNIKAMGFIVGNKVNDNSMNLIRVFIKSGHLIGNHSYSHYDLNKISAKLYINDINKCDSILEILNPEEKYFRYPLLHRGNSIDKKDSVLKFLAAANYQIVPVSIDNDEAEYNLNFVKAHMCGDSLKAGQIGSDYVNHMLEKIYYYQELVYIKNKTPIKHILLLHMNFINAFYLEEIILNLKADDWHFITVTDALSDPFYSRKENYLGKRGLSYIERVFNE